MVDYSELKQLAEAAPEGPWFGPEYAPGTSYVFDVDLGTLLHYESIDSEQDACLRYVAAANPAAVLALIAENKRLESEAVYSAAGFDAAREEIARLKAENAGLKTGYAAYEQAGVGLKAEVQALRKDAERYRWLRDQCGIVEYQAIAGSIGSGMLPSGESLDAALSAAIGQGEQS